MSDFAEFEPACWQENGVLVDFSAVVAKKLGSLGMRIGALFGTLAISLAMISTATEATLTVGAWGTADAPPIERQAFVASSRAPRDADIVSAQYWTEVRTLLDRLPAWDEAGAEPDSEPLI